MIMCMEVQHLRLGSWSPELELQWLWTVRCEGYEPTLDPLRKQRVLSIIEPSLLPSRRSQWLTSGISLGKREPSTTEPSLLPPHRSRWLTSGVNLGTKSLLLLSHLTSPNLALKKKHCPWNMSLMSWNRNKLIRLSFETSTVEAPKFISYHSHPE